MFPYDSQRLASALGCHYTGENQTLTAIASPAHVLKAGTLTYINSSQYLAQLSEEYCVVVIASETLSEGLKKHTHIVSQAPRLDFSKALALLYPDSIRPQVSPGIHPSAVVSHQANIPDDVFIGPNCVIEAGVTLESGVYLQANVTIGKNARIGLNTAFYASVTIYPNTCIGDNCIVHSGAVIGSDGFGNEPTPTGWVKVPQIGRVVIGDMVEIGANTSIDCGAIEDTVIHDGVKLDNLIQVGHNCVIGAHTAIAAGTAIAGSSIIGKNCTIAGQVGIAGHLEICDNTHITAKTMISKSITESGSYSSGTSMDSTRRWRKNTIRYKQLDTLARKLQQIEKELKNIKRSS